MNELEYDDDMVDLLGSVWGEGYMSPGGPKEVDVVLSGLDLAGKTVLDIGCGAGGIDLHLVNAYQAARVTGIDVEPGLIERCRRLAASKGLEDRLEFIRIEPGPLPFEEGRFAGSDCGAGRGRTPRSARPADRLVPAGR